MLISKLGDYSDAYIVMKGRISVRVLIMLTQEIKSQLLRIILHLVHAYQKPITHVFTMQKLI